MSEHPIEGLMSSAMKSIRQMVEVNTIIGEPLKTPNGIVIIPVSKVGFGFAAGGSEFIPDSLLASEAEEQEIPFGGGSGGGVSITPVAFLVLKENEMELVHMDQHTHLYEKIIDLLPELLNRKHSRAQQDKEETTRPKEKNSEKPSSSQEAASRSEEKKKEKSEIESLLSRFEI